MNKTLTIQPKTDDTRRSQIAAFFKSHRLKSGLTADAVARDLALESVELLLAYESGAEAIPLDEIFALTNLLNIAPEDVLALIYDAHGQGSN